MILFRFLRMITYDNYLRVVINTEESVKLIIRQISTNGFRFILTIAKRSHMNTYIICIIMYRHNTNVEN